MIIKIFDENDRDFKSNGNIAIDPLKCKETKKKSLNGWYIEVEASIKYKKYIQKDKLCVIKTKSKLNPQAFRIGNPEIENRIIRFTATHVMFDAERYFLVDVRPTDKNGQNALSYINERTDKKSPFTIFSNVSTESTAYFIRKNLLEAWTVIEERWNGVFDADNWQISFLKKVGNDNGETIAYGKNMQGIRIFEDWSNVCTRIYPVGSDELMLDEKYIDSDIQYNIPYTRTETFNSELEFEEGTSEDDKKQKLLEELRHNAEAYLEENKYPKVSYEVNSNINQNMEIGDTIHVKHPLVTLLTEVLEYVHNSLTGKIETLVFGNYARDVKSRFDSIKDSIQKVQDNLMEGITKQDIVIKQQTELINSMNKNGIVYIDENEILILDKIPKETAKNVWRFGLGGIGFSSNGYEGPFETAITMDGQINAKFITTGTMSVARIEGLQNTLNNYLVSIELNSTNIQQLVGTQNSIIEKFNNYTTTENMQTLINQSADGILETASKIYTKQTDFTTGLSTTKKESIEEAVKSASLDTDTKLKSYSTTQEMNGAIDLKFDSIKLEVSEKYTTKKEFTTGMSTTKNEAISSAVNSANTNTENKLKSYSTTTEMNAAIKLQTDAINLEVKKKLNESEFGTKLQLSSNDVKIAWNNISKYIQFEAGELRIYDTAVSSTQKLRSIFDYNGSHFYRDDYYVGKIGTNQLKNDSTVKGLDFDLDQGLFMTWGSKPLSGGTDYIMRLSYARRDLGGTLLPGLNLGATLYTNNEPIIMGTRGASCSIVGVNENQAAIKTTDWFLFIDIDYNEMFAVSKDNVSIHGTLDMNGWNIVNAGDVSSDGRLKKDIYSSKINAIERIKRIRHREFSWKKDNKKENIGYIAQELKEIDENYIRQNIEKDKDGNIIDDRYEIKLLPILATATKAIQEQQEIIEKQAALIDIIKEKLGLEKEIDSILNNKISLMSIEEETVYEGELIDRTRKKAKQEEPVETIMRKYENGQIEFIKK